MTRARTQPPAEVRPVSVSLTPQLVNRLDAAARRQQVSRSLLVREFVEAGLDRLDAEPAAPPALYVSGPSQLPAGGSGTYQVNCNPACGSSYILQTTPEPSWVVGGPCTGGAGLLGISGTVTASANPGDQCTLTVAANVCAHDGFGCTSSPVALVSAPVQISVT